MEASGRFEMDLGVRAARLVDAETRTQAIKRSYEISDPDPEEGVPGRHWALSWLKLGKPAGVTRKRLVIVGVLSSSLVLCCAAIVGMILNLTAFEDISGQTAMDGTHTNYFEFMAASAAVALCVALPRFLFRYFAHPRLYGIFSFWMYVVLGLVVLTKLYEPYYHPGTNPSAAQTGRAVLNLAGNTLPWNDSNNASVLLQTTELQWMDLVSAADFYNWLKQPMRYVITGMKQNQQSVGNLDYIPTLISNASNAGGYAVWNLLQCELRQVRSKVVSIQDQSRYGAFWTRGVKVFDEDRQDKSVRRFPDGSPMETYLGNKYVTAFDKKWQAVALPGFYYTYPGRAGQRTVGKNMTGVWVGSDVTPAEYLQDVARMEEHRWIDEHTAMVALGCAVEVPAQNLLVYFLHSAETTAPGLFRPNAPWIGVEFIEPRFHLDQKVDVIALHCWYYFAEELQDLLVMGPALYVRTTSRQSNLNDMVAVVMGLVTIGMFYTQLSYRKSSYDDHFYSQMAVSNAFQLCSGLFLFFVAIKGIKFTKNVPTMRTFGDTIGACLGELVLFLLMLAVLFLAFAFIFNTSFSTRIDEFATIGRSLLSLFRGCVGDLDFDALYFNEPVLAPYLYLFYITVCFFFGFTILIAVISAGYDRATALPERDGVITAAVRSRGLVRVACANTSEGTDDTKGEAAEGEEDPTVVVYSTEGTDGEAAMGKEDLAVPEGSEDEEAETEVEQWRAIQELLKTRLECLNQKMEARRKHTALRNQAIAGGLVQKLEVLGSKDETHRDSPSDETLDI